MMLNDFRFALRQLRKSPAFTVAAIATLAVGIGVNTAVFSFMDALVLRPLAVPDLSRVVTVSEDRGHKDTEYEWVAMANYQDWKQQSRSFQAMATYRFDSMSLTGSGDASHVAAIETSSSLFSVLQTGAALGRVLTQQDCQPGRDGEAVLSYPFWRQHFGSQPGVLGRTMDLNGRSYTIVGVLPRTMNYPTATDVYLPLALTPQQLHDRSAHGYQVVARLRDGASVAGAQAELQEIAARLSKMYPATNLGWSAHVESLVDNINGRLTPLYVKMLMGATLFVLLVVCANVANLGVTRGIARRPEIAMRTALGASRSRLLRQLLAENLLLGIAGAAGGVLIADLYLRISLMFMPPLVARNIAGWTSVGVNGRALGYSLLLAVLAGVVSGMAPAFSSLRVNLVEQLKSGSRTDTGSGRSHRLRNFFAAAQIALAIALVTGAALMSKGMWNSLQFANIFQPERVLMFRVTLPASRYSTQQQQSAWYAESLNKLRALPGVKSASVTTQLPYGDGWWVDDFQIEHRPLAPGKFRSAVRVAVSDDYFGAMHIPILSGRSFAASDGLESQPVAVISRTLAEQYFPGEDPIGRKIRMGASWSGGEPWMTVVGIVADASYEWIDQTPQPAVYLDVAQLPPTPADYLLVSRSDNPSALAPEVRRTMAALDPALPLDQLQTYAKMLQDSLTGLSYAAANLVVDALIAWLLAALGIFAAMANLVAERRREIGVRLALGARREDVLRMILRRAAILTGSGMVVGLLLAVALARAIAGLLYGVRPGDPVIFTTITLAIAAAALAASWIPAQAASGLDPMDALRDE